jgi:hypothetical protein
MTLAPTGPHEVELDAMLVRPRIEHAAGEFGSVVAGWSEFVIARVNSHESWS